MPRGVLVVFAVVAASVVLGVPLASSDSVPVTDIAVTLAGPSDGQVGDVLIYAMTVTNNGPDTAREVFFDFSYDATVFTLVGSDGSCGLQTGGIVYHDQCGAYQVASGASVTAHFQLRVEQHTNTQLYADGAPDTTTTDPNNGNNSQALSVLGAPTPSNQNAPTVSGQANVGATLTASTGTWSPSYDYTYSYHWLRCNPAGNSCATLNGSSSYPLTSDDAGCTLQVVVTASDAHASSNAVSTPTAVVQPDRTCNPSAGTGGSGSGGGGGGTGAPAPTFSFVPALPHAHQYVGYFGTLVTGTTHLLRFTLVTGALPSTFGFDSGNYGINGVAREAGTYTFTVQVTDLATNASAQHEFTLIVDPYRVIASSTSTRPATSTHVPSVAGCWPKAPQTRPRSILVACGDGNFTITGIRWSTWTATAATGAGTGHYNDCTPDCARRHFHLYRVSLRLHRPVRCRNGRREFTRFTYTFVGAKPLHSVRSGTEKSPFYIGTGCP